MVRATSDPLLQKPVLKPPPAPAPQPPEVGTATTTTAPPVHQAVAAAAAAPTGVTIEFQRQQAKAMQQYFRGLKLEESVEQGRMFGWTRKNEIRNGRWVMTGLAVGLLTEYATGVDFVEQIKMMVSYLGLLDLD